MSFLNPVNEPVLRFKSTDAGAPQINYNARVAGDVKTVLKACLVTGYGDKASAGWSVVNEVEHVAEFVSPSAAMSDYRLGIDDTSTSTTTWYYQYQDVRTNPSNNAVQKAISDINKSDSSNGWQLIVTQRGILLVEFFAYNAGGVVSRVTYLGALKQSTDGLGRNICFLNSGQNGVTYYAVASFNAAPQHAYINGASTNLVWFGPIYTKILNPINSPALDVQIDSALYIAKTDIGFAAQFPAFYMSYGGELDLSAKQVAHPEIGQSCLRVVLGSQAVNTLPNLNKAAIALLIPLETWGY